MSSLEQLQRNWEELAQADPMWAICTDPARRHGKWTHADFFATGCDEIGRVMQCVREIPHVIDDRAPALDFGCGVGRLARALAGYFPECWGVDISPTMVRLASEFNEDVPQCRFLLNQSSDLRKLPDNYFGFVYTSIVLQHIAPRYSRKYLADLVRVTRPGGILVFQVLDDFRAPMLERWRQKLGLRRRWNRMTPNGDRAFLMDLHCIAEADVRKVMDSARARIVDVRWTNSTQPSFNGRLEYLAEPPAQGYVSKQYCVIKDTQPPAKDRKQVGD
jgi:SAM-dependent methyltransferase